MSSRIPELFGHGFETKAVHAGQSPNQWTNREIIPPLSLSTTYLQPAPGQPVTFEYSRSGNPTRQALETSLAALESGRFGLLLLSLSPANTMPAFMISSDIQLGTSCHTVGDAGSAKDRRPHRQL